MARQHQVKSYIRQQQRKTKQQQNKTKRNEKKKETKIQVDNFHSILSSSTIFHLYFSGSSVRV